MATKKVAQAFDAWSEKFTKAHKSPLIKANQVAPYKVIPTGSLALDYALGIGGWVEGRLVELWGQDAIGKGHPVDHPVLTPDGWREIGHLEMGDEIIGSDGRATEVVGIYDRGELPVYRVRFNDGAEVVCDADHLWRVRASKGWVTYSTRSLMEDKTLQDAQGVNRYQVPLVEPIQHPWVDLPVDPYLLGALIANGHLQGTPRIASNDEHVRARVMASGETIKESTSSTSTASGLSVHDIRDRLRVLGLYGKRSGEKFVPSSYLFASEMQRRYLLAGLLDCDGSSGKETNYHTTSHQLALDVQALVRSLGGVARVHSYPRTHPDGRPYTMHAVGILLAENPFTTPRKAAIWKAPTKRSRRMVSITPEGKSQVRCIKVAADDALYVTSDYVVTHNTTLSLLSVVEAQKAYPDKLCAFIDVEQTFDRGLATGLGVDMDRLMVFTPENAEKVADALKDLVMARPDMTATQRGTPGTNFFKLIVLDSIGAMIPEVEKEKDADAAVVAAQAKVITRMVKIAATEARINDSVVLMINQVRANLSKWGPETMTSGGWALKHGTTHKVQLARSGGSDGVYRVKVEGEERVVGYQVAARVERNKVAPPGKVAIMNLFNQPTETYGPRGIDKADEALILGLRREVGMIVRSGAWYTLTTTGERVQGQDAMRDLLRAQPDEVEKIRLAAVASLAGEVVVDAPAPDGEPDGEDEDDELLSPEALAFDRGGLDAPAHDA